MNDEVNTARPPAAPPQPAALPPTKHDKPKKPGAGVIVDNRPQLIGAFVERGGGAKLTELLVRHGVFFVTAMPGQGTASSDILDILGLESAEKDAVWAVATFERASAVMNRLNDRLGGATTGKGIAFRASLSAASNILVTSMFLRAKQNFQEGKKMTAPNSDAKTNYSLIFLSVNQGYADEVMAAAKAAGARGGTLLRATQAATDGTIGLFGSTFSEAREVIAILTPVDKRNAILDAVSSSYGMRSDAGVVAIALAVEDVAKLS